VGISLVAQMERGTGAMSGWIDRATGRTKDMQQA
jgi:hypothetical protein